MNKYTRGVFISVCVFFALSLSAGAADYTIDPAHSFVEFRIQHLGYSWLYGRFNDIKGDFIYDEAKTAKSSFSVEIGTASIDSNHAERDKHLRSSDFLDVDKFPKAAFKSKSFDGVKLVGDLTLHGVTKEIVIDVKKVGEGKDPWGGYRAGFIGTTKIDRNDFGIGYNLGPSSKVMDFELGIEGIRK
ncbi:MAG: YceI family protein [bacterium]|nr:YceI family protein [bacterium]